MFQVQLIGFEMSSNPNETEQTQDSPATITGTPTNTNQLDLSSTDKLPNQINYSSGSDSPNQGESIKSVNNLIRRMSEQGKFFSKSLEYIERYRLLLIGPA